MWVWPQAAFCGWGYNGILSGVGVADCGCGYRGACLSIIGQGLLDGRLAPWGVAFWWVGLRWGVLSVGETNRTRSI